MYDYSDMMAEVTDEQLAVGELELANLLTVGLLIFFNIVMIYFIRKTLNRTSPVIFNADGNRFFFKRVENVPNWNRQHARGLMIYDLAVSATLIYPLLGIQLDDSGAIDGFLFWGVLILGLIGLVIQHMILEKKYIVDKEDVSNRE